MQRAMFPQVLSMIAGIAGLLLPGVLGAQSVPAVAQDRDSSRGTQDGVSEARRSEIFKGATPRTPAEARLLQRRTREVWTAARAATVSLGGATGVLVEGGYVLTAGHVAQRPGRRVSMRLLDGTRIRGETLGGNERTDTGVIRITSEGDYPALEIGDSSKLAAGAWVLMLGYPGSRRDEGPPLRFGRIQRNPARGYLVSDCRMCAGDSGGPLVDLAGRVVGINSRITRDLAVNMHVPSSTYLREWDDLVAGVWKSSGRARGRAYLGVEQRAEARGTRVVRVLESTAAQRAGLEDGDLITRFGGRSLADFAALPSALERRRPGERVAVVVQRGERQIELQVRLGSRNN